MNAYVMTADGIRVVEGAGTLEMHEDDVVLIRDGDSQHRPLAAVKLSPSLWVALGERPPASWSPESAPPKRAVLLNDGGWPPEPPPDVDSEG